MPRHARSALRGPLLTSAVVALTAGCGLFGPSDPTPEEAFREALQGEWLSSYEEHGGEGGTHLYRFSPYESPDGFSPSYILEADGATVSAGDLTVRRADGGPDTYILTYAARRGESLPPDRAHFEQDGSLVLQGATSVPRYYKKVPTLFGGALGLSRVAPPG